MNFELLGLLLGVSKTTANTTFHTWITRLRSWLPASLLEEVERGQRCESELLAELAKLELLVDYVGEAQIRTPQKQPKGGRLTSEAEAQNRVLAGGRIYIEHLMRRLKIFQVNSERYGEVMLVVCRLVRWRFGQGRCGELLTEEKSVDGEINRVNCQPLLLPFREKQAVNPDPTVVPPASRIARKPLSSMLPEFSDESISLGAILPAAWVHQFADRA